MKKPKVQVVQSSIDGVWYIQIDTDEAFDDPILRVYLNDGLIYELPPLAVIHSCP